MGCGCQVLCVAKRAGGLSCALGASMLVAPEFFGGISYETNFAFFCFGGDFSSSSRGATSCCDANSCSTDCAGCEPCRDRGPQQRGTAVEKLDCGHGGDASGQVRLPAYS